MLNEADNERLTRVGPGTPMGAMLRRYWQPMLLSSELPEQDCPPVRVRLLGEDLVAFRDTAGVVGLLAEHCAHRCASLFFGRNEEGGLRCTYHGWKYDVEGRCIDMPNEPPESNFKNKVKLTAYPCQEQGGVIWTYMGPSDKEPPLRGLEWMRASDEQRSITKTAQNCNWLQALEGGLDTSHVSFLHRDLEDTTSPWVRCVAPKLEVVRTDYGFRYAGIRNIDAEGNSVRLYHFVAPYQQARPAISLVDESPAAAGHLWVPIDDEHCWTYNWLYRKDGLTLSERERDLEEALMGRAPEEMLSDHRLRANKSNDYLIDRTVQRTKSYTGIKGINTQDVAIQESMGTILNRTQERLGTTDVAVITLRRILLEAIKVVQKGGDPVGFDGGNSPAVRPVQMLVPHGTHWYEVMREEEVAHW